MKIQLSKTQWEQIGKVAGWEVVSQKTNGRTVPVELRVNNTYATVNIPADDKQLEQLITLFVVNFNKKLDTWKGNDVFDMTNALFEFLSKLGYSSRGLSNTGNRGVFEVYKD